MANAFGFAVTCSICLRRKFQPDDLVAFRFLNDGSMRFVDLGGDRPKSGVRVICGKCRKFLAECPSQEEIGHEVA